MAFASYSQTWDVCGHEIAHMLNEYTYITKLNVHRSKDESDLDKLAKVVDLEVVSVLQHEAERADATLNLPGKLMKYLDKIGLND